MYHWSKSQKIHRRVEVEAFYVGGQLSGKRGRGYEGKIIVAVAVERSDKIKHIGRTHFNVTLYAIGYSFETCINIGIWPKQRLFKTKRGI